MEFNNQNLCVAFHSIYCYKIAFDFSLFDMFLHRFTEVSTICEATKETVLLHR